MQKDDTQWYLYFSGSGSGSYYEISGSMETRKFGRQNYTDRYRREVTLNSPKLSLCRIYEVVLWLGRVV